MDSNTIAIPPEQDIESVHTMAVGESENENNNVSATVTHSLHVGLRPKFTPEEGNVIFRKEAGTKEHMEPQGETKELLEIIAVHLNAGKRMATNITWNSNQGCYKRLQQRFEEHENVEYLINGVRGEVREVKKIMMERKEARDDREVKKTSEALQCREKEKGRHGCESTKNRNITKNK